MRKHNPLGVDIERVRPFRPAMARRHFSPRELARLEALPSAERDLFCWRLWTLKESYGKANGIGLGYPLNQLSFDLGENSLTTDSDDRFAYAQSIVYQEGKTLVISYCFPASLKVCRTAHPVSHIFQTALPSDHFDAQLSSQKQPSGGIYEI
jgi:phosphopantetheine--protein transferase-like protein